MSIPLTVLLVGYIPKWSSNAKRQIPGLQENNLPGITGRCNSYMAEPQERTLEDWAKSWDNNRTGWHLDHVNSNLTENIEFLTDGKQNRRIFVPLCGKTLDLLWLVKQGHTVIGVEAVPKAVEDFFKENDISYEKKTLDGYGQCFMAFGGKLKIFNCDFFKFNSSLAGGKVDGIWDCNALGAISPNDWSQILDHLDPTKLYLQTLLELLNRPHGRILVQAFLYDQDEYKGPPYSVPIEKLGGLLGDSYELQLVNKKPAEEARARFGPSWLYNTLISVKYKK